MLIKSKNFAKTSSYAVEPSDLCFDERFREEFFEFLYKADSGPRSANIISPLTDKMKALRKAYEEGSADIFSECLLDLVDISTDIPEAIFVELIGYLKDLIPSKPKAILPDAFSTLRQAIEWLWGYAVESKWELSTGHVVYKWYEHYGFFNQAIFVLQRLCSRNLLSGDIVNRAVLLNNLAFVYMLAGRFEEGAPIFGNAADRFSEAGCNIDYYNSRANYLLCRLYGGEFGQAELYIEEAKEIRAKLDGFGDWRSRKPYIIFAMIEEKRGNIVKAISHIEDAISCASDNETRFPEEDEKHLAKLLHVKLA